ncbi:hypothetical protein DID88_007819 [Monilinia fructigena]|uniref:Uncharacterized protein n=1 Tax=Monilinia fructigena TaxID=38457 RepID=A0A395J8K0_9HELO|nr:hypothetical protein DID88_007819 [Monilinia fructigena]
MYLISPSESMNLVQYQNPTCKQYAGSDDFVTLELISPIICLRGLTCPYLSGSTDLRSPYSQSLSNSSELLVDSKP